MNSSDPFTVSTVAYIVAFAVLTVLAIMMRLITLLFPEKRTAEDAAVIAAITTTYQTLSPGSVVTKIEETQ